MHLTLETVLEETNKWSLTTEDWTKLTKEICATQASRSNNIILALRGDSYQLREKMQRLSTTNQMELVVTLMFSRIMVVSGWSTTTSLVEIRSSGLRWEKMYPTLSEISIAVTSPTTWIGSQAEVDDKPETRQRWPRWCLIDSPLEVRIERPQSSTSLVKVLLERMLR